jgi:hypothetical protein
MTSHTTSEKRVAKAFGLDGDHWMQHANAWSVWTRFAVVPMLVVSVWSRDWIGWWSLVPIALSVVFMVINPRLFKPPKSTKNWASKGVFGERIWADRKDVNIPAKYLKSRVPWVATIAQALSLIVLVYGLVRLDLVAVIAGTLMCQIAKSWYIDRMVLLFEDMKERNPEYASWEF